MSLVLVLTFTLLINIAETLSGSSEVLSLMNRSSGRNILIYVLAISIFCLVKYVEGFSSPTVNFVAANTFGVYVVHDNIVMRGMNELGTHSLLWDGIMHLDWRYANSLWFGSYCLATVLLVFVVCTALSWVWRASVGKALESSRLI